MSSGSPLDIHNLFVELRPEAPKQGSRGMITLVDVKSLLAAEEGLEVNVLGLNVGLDAAVPALKLPAIGRLGLDR